MKLLAIGIILIGVLFLNGCLAISPPDNSNGNSDNPNSDTVSDCGNGVCDSGETKDTCSADCKDGTSTDDDSCSSNSDCEYKQKCKSGQCVTVECTTDSQCSGCRRCSDNTCVSCGSGPYGCYC